MKARHLAVAGLVLLTATARAAEPPAPAGAAEVAVPTAAAAPAGVDVPAAGAEVTTPAAPAAPVKAWSNETELSFVVTDGNSDTKSFGVKDTLVRRWSGSRLRVKLEALRTATADDWYLAVDPGYTWEPGEGPPPLTQTLVKPPAEPDAENYFVEGRYDHEIGKTLDWHAGASWDRNKDAGILSRTILFTGLGNGWWDRPGLRLQTSYGLSYTDREEETPDPEKETRFAGARASALFFLKITESTTFDNDTVFNVSLADTSDWSAEMTNSLSVSISKRLSLRVSLRLLYNSEPALEDVDVTARVELRNPDGVPGSGDEYFETVGSGGIEITLGEADVRKEELDLVFKTTLVVSF